jgi:hypothetical protein
VPEGLHKRLLHVVSKVELQLLALVFLLMAVGVGVLAALMVVTVAAVEVN